MALVTCDVSCAMFGPDGEPEVGALFEATLDRTEVYAGFVVPERVSGRTDESGVVVLKLWPNQLGSTESVYNIKMTSARGRTERVEAVVPDVGSVNLHDITTLPAYPGKSDGALSLDAAITAGQQALAALDAALTAQEDAELAQASAGASATSATASATTATTKASEASASASSADASAATATAKAAEAAASEANAAASAVTANARASDATFSAASALSYSTSAGSSASTATAQASSASSSASTASAAATSASASAGTATTQAGIATTKASEAAASAALVNTSNFVSKQSGAARPPSWTTATRPSSPQAGDFGHNSTTGLDEAWDGTSWVPRGQSGSGSVSTVGSSVDALGIPPYARRVTILLTGWSSNDTNGCLIQLGSASGVATSGYTYGATSVTGSSAAGLGPLQGLPIFINTASGAFNAVIELVSSDGQTWFMSSVAGYNGSNNCLSFASIALAGALDRVRFTKYSGGSCDAGVANIVWRA